MKHGSAVVAFAHCRYARPSAAVGFRVSALLELGLLSPSVACLYLAEAADVSNEAAVVGCVIAGVQEKCLRLVLFPSPWRASCGLCAGHSGLPFPDLGKDDEDVPAVRFSPDSTELWKGPGTDSQEHCEDRMEPFLPKAPGARPAGLCECAPRAGGRAGLLA